MSLLIHILSAALHTNQSSQRECKYLYYSNIGASVVQTKLIMCRSVLRSVLLSHNEPKEAFKAYVAFLTKLNFLFLKERYLWVVTRIQIVYLVYQVH